ncbi:MAG: universal stress protein [Acidobacteriia bacterium]|nr:universal stress protein [Terriglobia bacterium]
MLLGSVSQKVAVHAHGPVVIVRGRPNPDDGEILVGVDGSPQGQHALQVAFDEAVVHGTGVVAVRTYSLLASAADPGRRRRAHRRLHLLDLKQARIRSTRPRLHGCR